MSYDLNFIPQTKLTLEDFNTHFQARGNCTTENQQAWYENPDTGVYFSFDFEPMGTEEDCTDPEEPYIAASLNINYMRPSYFANEAEIEIKAFIQKFNMTVEDPQSGIAGPFNSESYYIEFTRGNQFASQYVNEKSSDDAQGISVLPATTLHEVWQWNYARKARQAKLGDHLYVPKIMFVGYQGNPSTAISWPDAIPTLIPKVDVLIIPRAQLAPRKFFIKVKNTATITHDAFNYQIEKHKTKNLHNAALLDYTEVPQDLAQAITDLPKDNGSLEIVLSNDQVLDTELI